VPRYFFHVDGDLRDDEGCSVEDLAKAKCEAVSMAGKLICEDSSAFWEKKDWGMTVTDEAGLILFTLTFFATESAAAVPA
jgi:hypothetical protein